MPDHDLQTSRLLEPLRRRGHRALGVEALAGDVSARRYYRLRIDGGGTVILAVYPSRLLDACGRFRHSSALLEGAGVPVPAILDSDCAAGWMLLEDLGDVTLYDMAGEPWPRIEPFLTEAARLARAVAGLPAAEVAALNPPLDEALLRRELRQTWELLLAPRGLTGPRDLARRFATSLRRLCAALAAEPPVPCHRDLMARNLVPKGAAPALAVLDHQDLRLGPPGYDLASLLNDSLFPPPEVERCILDRSARGAAARLSYRRAAAQRTLKAAGTFEAFARRGSDRHVPLIRPTLERALAHLGRLPETRQVAPDLAALWRRRGGRAPIC